MYCNYLSVCPVGTTGNLIFYLIFLIWFQQMFARRKVHTDHTSRSRLSGIWLSESRVTISSWFRQFHTRVQERVDLSESSRARDAQVCHGLLFFIPRWRTKCMCHGPRRWLWPTLTQKNLLVPLEPVYSRGQTKSTKKNRILLMSL